LTVTVHVAGFAFRRESDAPITRRGALVPLSFTNVAPETRLTVALWRHNTVVAELESVLLPSNGAVTAAARIPLSVSVGNDYFLVAWETARSSNFAWSAPFGIGPTARNDYDGDGFSDLALYDPARGAWHILSARGRGAVLADGIALGTPGSIPVPGDYDGDGRFDLAVYDPATSAWCFRSLAAGAELTDRHISWGVPGSAPVSGDFDGDGAHDLALYQRGTGKWFIRSLRAGALTALAIEWGASNAAPIAADVNGDGAADLVVQTSPKGNWFVRSLLLLPDFPKIWPCFSPNGALMPGDYDGDLREDLCVFVPASRWFVRRTGVAPSVPHVRDWGGPGYVPVRGDYNGDGQDDLGVFVPQTGRWYACSAMNGASVLFAVRWGGPGMTCVGAAP
jgi:hypothetical protein